MKAIKMIGLAALMALTAMAFVGATSAMAESTTLCSADGSGCGLTHVHETSVGKAKLLTSLGTTECNVLFLGDGESEGNPLVIEGNFTYTNCTLGGSSCTATEENGPSEIKVLKEGHETAKVTGEGLVHLVCGFSIDCSYNGTNLVGTAKGPLLSTQANGEVSLSEQSTTKETGGFLCPKSAKLDLTTTPLSATYLASEGGGCTEAPSVTTTSASSVTYNSAYMNGEVNPHGCETSYFFEIKKSTSETWERRFTQFAGSGTSPVPVSEWEPFLQPETTYEYRLNATSVGGSKQGSTVKFTTLKEPPSGKNPRLQLKRRRGSRVAARR